MKRSLDNEQFYTTPENVDFCLSKIDFQRYTRVIEPSAGDVAFSSKIDGCIAMDICPEAPGIIRQDFLLYVSMARRGILTIGNPPFGRQSSLAVKFVNHAAVFSDTIAFILPNSFKKASVLRKLANNVVLQEVYPLPSQMFNFEGELREIPCSFFIFETVVGVPLADEQHYATADFTFVPKSGNPDNSIRRVGFYAGRIEDPDAAESSHYFVKWNYPGAISVLENIKWTFNNTVGPRSLSKDEIVKAYLEAKENDNQNQNS